MNQHTKVVKHWEDTTNIIAREFVKKYFAKYCANNHANENWVWIDDDIGGILMIGGYHFVMSTIRIALKFDINPIIFYNFHNHEIDCMDRNTHPLSLEEFIDKKED